MRKIENFAQISDLLNAQASSAVSSLTTFCAVRDYTHEIENGLYIHEADGALLLFCGERGDHLVMTFYLHPNAVLSPPEKGQAARPSCPAARKTRRRWSAAEQFRRPKSAARGAPANRKHFRRNNRSSGKSRRISRIFPAF